MNPVVLYTSKSGNTGKIAESIAAQLNCEALKVTAQTHPASLDLDSYDLIFVGTGLYAGTPNEDIVKFLGCLNLKTQKQFALFITWGGAPGSDKLALGKLRTLLKGKGQTVIDEHFAAYGGWRGILMKRGHPKIEEIKAAAAWAEQITKKK
jgi:flavodoxin